MEGGEVYKHCPCPHPSTTSDEIPHMNRQQYERTHKFYLYASNSADPLQPPRCHGSTKNKQLPTYPTLAKPYAGLAQNTKGTPNT